MTSLPFSPPSPPSDYSRSLEDKVIELTVTVGGLAAVMAGLQERLVGDIKRLETLHSGVIREVDNARNSHADLHVIEKEHLGVAREAQEHRNKSLNGERERQALRDDKFAQKETVEAAMNAMRRQVDDNGTRIRELELAQRGSTGERTGAVDFKREGRADVAQVVSYGMAALAVVAIIVTILIANFT